MNASACRAGVAANLTRLCRFTYLFVAGLHHSGTSLVHELIGRDARVSRLNVTSYQGEGLHVQHALTKISKLTSNNCSRSISAGNGNKVAAHDWVAKYFCRSREIDDDDAARASLLGSWEPLWDADSPFRVEKDPDLGSVFVKVALFARVSLPVFVVRHPFATALGYGDRCRSAGECALVWLEVWTLCLRTLRRDATPHAVVRYETLVHRPEPVVAAVLALASGESDARRLGLLRKKHGKAAKIDASLCWANHAWRVSAACGRSRACAAAMGRVTPLLPIGGYTLDPNTARLACTKLLARPDLACSHAAPCDPPKGRDLGDAIALLGRVAAKRDTRVTYPR